MSDVQYGHRPVLLDQVLEGLEIIPHGIYVDCTFGRGGHARAILARLGEDGRLFAIDRDPSAVMAGSAELAADSRFEIEQGSFTMLAEMARKAGVMGKVNGVLFDLGVSSPQLDDPARGFSFSREGPLDMRMGSGGVSAADWLATVGFGELVGVLREYGEERYAKRIARSIIDARLQAPIQTTGKLAEIIARAKPTHERDIHPATRAFQAIRIAINNELEEIKQVLSQVVDVLAPAGRLLVISFHSLEDRIVKRFMRDEARGDPYPPSVPIPASELRPRLRLIGKAVRASEREIRDNPRARSAVLRIAERLA